MNAENQAPTEEQSFRLPNKTPLLNRAAVKELLLQTAKDLRPFHKWNRVSSETLVKLNEVLRAAAVGHIKSLPSKGKTI